MERDGFYWLGDKVQLRNWTADDWEIDQTWHLDASGERNAGYVQFPVSEASLRKHAEEQSMRGLGDGSETINLIIETLSGTPVGCINTHEVDRQAGSFFYGLYVSPDARRNGFAAEAILLITRFYFFERRFQKVNANVYAFNEASIRLHESLGFQLEGRHRQVLFADGRHHDVLRFGLTLEEFLEKHAGWLSSRPARVDKA